MIRKLIRETFVDAEAHAQHYRQLNTRFDRRFFFLCVYVAFAVSMTRYFGDFHYLIFVLRAFGLNTLGSTVGMMFSRSSNQNLASLAYWILVNVVFYLLLPLVVIRLWKRRVSDYGLSFKNTGKDFRLYAGMFLIMIPVVFLFSMSTEFQQRYPFYDPAPGEPLFPVFFIWEGLYLLQFVALEFFFRGFMVHGLKNRLGFYAIPVMTIPYCMIHLYKPLPETLAAIVAGMVLGTLSLKSRSIWWGVAIHYSVALSMDLAALWQKGFFES